MTSHRIKGGAGIDLYVEETGNPDGQPILFIHGFSQSRLAWTKQLRSELGDDLRLVALDLRGHGESEHPHGAYGEPFLWADDIDAVITELHLRRPILCGWSYGGVVIGDYLRCHGSDALGGIVLVGAVSRLGESVMPYLGPGYVAALPGLFSTDAEDSTTALQDFLRLCTSAAPAAEEFYAALGYNSVVPPHVRHDMLSRTVEYDDLYARLDLPMLITHGLDDRIVLPSMSVRLAELIPHARTSYYDGIGHTPFREDPQRFNAELHAFAAELSGVQSPSVNSAA